MSVGDGSENEVFRRAVKDVKPIPNRDKVKPRSGSSRPRGSPGAPPPLTRTPEPPPRAAPTPPPEAHDALQRAHDALQRAHDALRARLEEVEGTLNALRTQHDTLRAERDDLKRASERGPAPEPLPAPEPPPLPTPRPLANVDLSGEQLVRTLETLVAYEPGRVARLLLVEGDAPHFKRVDDRVALACAACRPRLPRGVVAVSDLAPEACELCGGSATQRNFQELVAACAAAQVRRILVLGGSPAYREAAQRLVEGAQSPLSIDFVGEGAKPKKKRASARAASADLVVIWCSTQLDHTTTAAFDDVDAPRVVVSKRGIGSMFAQVAETLIKRGARGR